MAGRTLIIPDVHNGIKKAEELVGREGPDLTVFLGDYFDSFYEDAGAAGRTARWLAGSLESEERVHLIGNHDLGYMTRNPAMRCSGFTEEKYFVIHGCSVPWDRLRAYHWLDGSWLCTHAGVSLDYVRQQDPGGLSIRRVLEASAADLERLDDAGRAHPYFQAGVMRGGPAPVGGPVWCDWSEFVPVPGVCQLFGHTRGDEVRSVREGDSENHCIDTGLGHYAIYEGGGVRIMESG